LTKVYEKTKKFASISELSWYNLYLTGEYSEEFKADLTLKEEFCLFCLWINSLIKEFYTNEKDLKVISYGFLNSPKDNKRDQPWHLDYGRCGSLLFVPLDNMTMLNSTQFIRGPYTNKKSTTEMGYYLFKEGPNEVMQSDNRKWIELGQVICKSFTILKLYSGVVHRGKIYS
jgi:hypothetical protein